LIRHSQPTDISFGGVHSSWKSGPKTSGSIWGHNIQ